MSENYPTKRLLDYEEHAEQLHHEVERKLVPLDPDFFEPYKQTAIPIEQIYLSRPEEDYTLRVRAAYTPNGEEYSATLKNKGVKTPYGLSRLEVETPITRETFESYARNEQLPRVKKLRATITEGVTIDWIDGVDLPLVEIEDGDRLPGAAAFYEDYQQVLEDRTGDPALDNSMIAYEQYGIAVEALPELHAEAIVSEMIATLHTGKPAVVVGISGMSGSGKTTLANEVEHELWRRFGEELPQPVRVSTDDYHRGKTWLEATHGHPWTNWDAPEVYHTAALADDIQKLLNSEIVDRKRFDFGREETVIEGKITPSPFIIIEGIFAGSTDLKEVRDLHFTVPTPLATTVGRDLLRLVHSDRPNASIANPEARLRYQLETAIPTFEAQDRPRRNVWSASVRPIGQVALRVQNTSATPAQ